MGHAVGRALPSADQAGLWALDALTSAGLERPKQDGKNGAKRVRAGIGEQNGDCGSTPD